MLQEVALANWIDKDSVTRLDWGVRRMSLGSWLGNRGDSDVVFKASEKYMALPEKHDKFSLVSLSVCDMRK